MTGKPTDLAAQFPFAAVDSAKAPAQGRKGVGARTNGIPQNFDDFARTRRRLHGRKFGRRRDPGDVRPMPGGNGGKAQGQLIGRPFPVRSPLGETARGALQVCADRGGNIRKVIANPTVPGRGFLKGILAAARHGRMGELLP